MGKINLKATLQKLTKKPSEPHQRITNNVLEDVRHDVIKKGRRFKYPVQYERHKVIINALAIAFASVIIITFLAWWSLYKQNSDSLVLFKLTQFLPLTVGKVDDEPIYYSDYLAQYRTSTHWYRLKETVSSNSLHLVEAQFRKDSFNNAGAIAFATKLARESNLKISNEEVNSELESIYRNNQLSAGALDSIAKDNYGLSSSEYKRFLIRNALLIRKVSFAIDDSARNLTEQVKTDLKSNSDFTAVAGQYGGDKLIFSETEVVEHGRADNDGLVAEVMKLAVGQISEPFASTGREGYYFVKLVAKDDTTVRYQSLLVPLKEFDNRLMALRTNHQVESYIPIDLVANQEQQNLDK